MSRTQKPPRPPKLPRRTTSPRAQRPLKALLPAPTPPPRTGEPPPIIVGRKVSFLDLPAELRIEIYHLILKDVRVQILPQSSQLDPAPVPLALSCRQIRDEVLPIIHTICHMDTSITDLDFSGLLTFLTRIGSAGQANLAKNLNLSIHFTWGDKMLGDLPTLRRWLHDRADVCRPQPLWKYKGTCANAKLANDLRRRLKRMKEVRKAEELRKIVRSLGVQVWDLPERQAGVVDSGEQ